MIKQEGLGTAASGEAKELVRAKNALRDTLKQQEDSVNNILAKEVEIAKKRQGYLTEYFNSYSSKLNSIQNQYGALLDNTFELLNKKLTDNYKSLSSEISKLEQQSKNISKQYNEQSNKAESTSQKRNVKADNATLGASGPQTELLSAILGEVKELNRYAANRHDYESSSSAQETAASLVGPTTGVETSSSDSAVNANNNSIPVENYIAEEDISKLEVIPPSIFDELNQLKSLSKEAQDEITAAWKSGDQEQLDSAEAKYGAQAVLLTEQLQRVKALNESHQAEISKKEEELQGKLTALMLAQEQSKEASLTRQTEFRLKELDKVITAELEAQNFINNLNEEIAYANSSEAGDLRARDVNAKEELTSAKKLAEQKAEYIAKAELAAKRKNNGVLDKEEAARIQKEANEKFKADKANLDKLTKERQKEEQKKNKQENRKKIDAAVSEPLTKDNNLLERFKILNEASENKTAHGSSGEKAVALVDTALTAISDLAAKLDKSIDKIASYQGFIDTRLQGSNNKTNYAGSYWGQLTKDMMSVGAVTPFFKQETFAENIKTLVNQGIAFDLKQRAFLMTIQEKIANTFNVADGTLLRLIRIQQEDSTAGRLGMESALNSFLNNMYETSEYLSDVAKSVRDSLQEMEALMPGVEATEVEYQVQKWMGSLYSVGMSQEAVNSITSALGQIAAGQIEALTSGNGAGNLMVMAANKADLPISDILANGLDAAETNKLLQATVNYLAELAESSKDSRVVQQQLASVFGVKASDLRAATNLANENTTEDVYANYLTYDNMLKRLNKMAGTMYQRTSIGEMMTNIWENGEYTLASSMANNPVAYLIYKMAGLLESATGGISLPAISVAGFGVDLETTVADLMRVASMSTGIIGSLGAMISGLSNSFDGQAMLSKMGIERGSGLKVTPRGNDGGLGATDISGGGQHTTSNSGYVGNASSSDIKNSTIQESEDTKKQHMIEAKEEAEATQIDFINVNVLKIYELLDEVTSGKRNFSVKVAGYGLTSLGNGTSIGGAQGGVAGVLNNSISNAGNSSLGSGFSSGSTSSSGNNANYNGSTSNSSGSNNSYNVGASVDLGGWTIV